MTVRLRAACARRCPLSDDRPPLPTASGAVVRAFLDAMFDKRRSDVLALCTEDATWWFNGSLDFSGSHPIEDVFAGAAQMFKDAVAPSTGGVGEIVAEGELASAEAWSRVELSGGRVYHNHVHMLFRLRGGKIASIKEYGDTELLLRLFGRDGRSSGAP
jgi:uncharacterized protein